MYTNASSSKNTSRRPAFLNHSLTGKPNFRTKNYTVTTRTEDGPNAKPLHPKTGTPPTPDTAFPSMGPKWTARRFVIDPPDDERGPDVGDPLRLHMHVCDMYVHVGSKLIKDNGPGCPVRRACSHPAAEAQSSRQSGLLVVCLPDTCMHGWEGGGQVSQSAACSLPSSVGGVLLASMAPRVVRIIYGR